MAAPTLQGSAVTATAAASSVTCTGAAAGDLCVLVMAGSFPTGGFTNTRINDVTAGGTDAGFAYHGESAGTGNSRARTYSKVLTAADFTTGTLHTFGPDAWGAGTARIFILVFRHARGWNANRLASYQHSEANVANSSVLFTLANPSPDAACVAVAVHANSAATINWDAAGFTSPLFSQGGANVDDKLYDIAATPTSIAWNAGQNTTNHASQALVFAVASPIFTTATETDTAFALGRKKTKALGTALETDLGVRMTQPGHGGGPLTTSAETDTARPLPGRKVRALGTALETTGTFSVSSSKGHTLGIATQAGTAFPLAVWKTSRTTVDLDDPTSLFPVLTATVHALVHRQFPTGTGEFRVLLNQGGGIIGTSSWVGLADTNIDATVTVANPGNAKNLTATVEVRTATEAYPVIDQVYVDLVGGMGTSPETEEARPLSVRHGRQLGPAIAQNDAVAITGRKAARITTVLETEMALPLSHLTHPPTRAGTRPRTGRTSTRTL